MNHLPVHPLNRALVALVLLAVGLTGCGGGEGTGGGAGGGTERGAVRIDGSSTVYPITEAVAEEFRREQPAIRVTVGVSGTGGGFEKFVRGEIDLNDASRPIKPSEVELARQNNVGYIELPVAYDGLAVVANPGNDWVDCLTVAELRQIWAPGSDVDQWSDVRPSFPDQPLTLYGPGTSSGTYDYFTEAVVGESGASRADFTASEDDNVLVQGIAGDPSALGFFGLAYYEENAEQLKLIGIDDQNPANGEGCVEPDTESVGNSTYQPLSRPLFLYVRESSANDAAVSSFVEFYLDMARDLAEEVGYVALSDAAYELARERFRSKVTGSIFGGEGAQVGVSMEEMLRREQDALADTTSTP